MKLLPFTLISILLLFSMGCSSVTVKSDYNKNVDFSKYKTYRWELGIKINPNDELSRHPSVLKPIQASIDKELQAKGFRPVDSGDPDFVVVTHGSAEGKTAVNQVAGTSQWGQPWWGPGGGYVSISGFDEGTLVIDIVDFEQEKLSWRGIGTLTIKDYRDSERARMQEDFNEIVAKIMASFPPE